MWAAKCVQHNLFPVKQTAIYKCYLYKYSSHFTETCHQSRGKCSPPFPLCSRICFGPLSPSRFIHLQKSIFLCSSIFSSTWMFGVKVSKGNIAFRILQIVFLLENLGGLSHQHSKNVSWVSLITCSLVQANSACERVHACMCVWGNKLVEDGEIGLSETHWALTLSLDCTLLSFSGFRWWMRLFQLPCSYWPPAYPIHSFSLT